MNYAVTVSDTRQSLNVTERPLNESVRLSMAFASKAHRVERQLRCLKSALNKLKSLKFRFGTHRPAVFKKSRGIF